MNCKANNCNKPGTWRERFSAVLCNYHHLLALLGWLNDKNRMLLMAYKDEAQGGAPNPLDHPRLQA